MTYYSVIGGWVLYYIRVFLTGNLQSASNGGFFSSFISSSASVWYSLLFMALTALIVYGGVEKGIERVSTMIMPVLLVMVVGIALYSLTLRYETPSGELRTGL